ncbi:hypothetical protein SAMN05421788_106112 [Filimonas lacunae]|uniref:Uncharacterized protein n=1 Tax=Filimonas lacunae TaxID=477680 RepID=A0A173MF37_9BACT|nr:hypothetical protein [Filimonas lacunae]BAV06041.1 hypothetical protein FLA_2056 [Filimonas lacunae]SIT24364.1 hypothetical protein SAMN05421788_106112 [Filimonas lacunae]
MAKYVCESPPVPGNYGIIQVYKRQGVTIARVRNPLCGKRVQTAPEFAGTRKYAQLLAIASPLASAVHQALPANRQRSHYQQLAGKAIQWLKEGKSEVEVRVLLQEAAEDIRSVLQPQRLKTGKARRSVRKKSVFNNRVAVIPFAKVSKVHYSRELQRGQSSCMMKLQV